jgi:hypothetical protein
MVGKRGKTTHTSSKHPAKHSSHASHAIRHVRHKRELPKPVLVEERIGRPPHELEEEFFVPSPIHRGKFRIPLGIKFLIGYLLFLSALYVVSFAFGITFPTTLLFGQMITGTRAMIINVVLLLIIFAIIYGFWKRKAYSFDLSIGLFSFSALNAVISLLLFESAEHPVFRKMLLLSFVSLVFMNVVVVWYIMHERKFFYSEQFHERPVHHRDKLFLYSIISFWVVTLLIGITMGVQFYKDTTLIIDKTISELNGNYYSGTSVCDNKQGSEKDICTLVVATALSGKDVQQSELTKLCDSIKSDFYRFTCMRSIKG